MADEMKFFMYLLEYYASHKNMKTKDVFNQWEKCGIVQTIYDDYWIYHTERIENAFEDIDSLISTGKHAW